jgi:hypothetical protein
MTDLVRPDPFDDLLLRRIRGEYLEMPGLRLTRPQAKRLWGLDDDTSARVLNVLVDLKFLVQASDGTYARLTEGTSRDVPLRMARANLEAAVPAPARQKFSRSA